jgi:hypothetical protein
VGFGFGLCSLVGGGGGASVVVVAVVVVVYEGVYVGVYEYDVCGAETVWPPSVGWAKYWIGSFAVAGSMNRCQISAGSVPPVTPATPST